MKSINKKITYIDLFAGAGGLSEGFTSLGYQPIAHVEMDKDACNTLKTRESFYYLKSVNKSDTYYDYLRKEISRDKLYEHVPKEILESVICETMSNKTLPSVFKKIDEALNARGYDYVDIILGGPPCQAYSTVGRSRKNMDGDPRNTLYKLYFKAIDRYKPALFVFENVPGLLTAGKGKYLKSIINGFKKRGYKLEYKVLNAADYGVLQNRKRIILIGWQKDSSHFYPQIQKIKKEFKVNDILSDLPTLEPGEEKRAYSNSIISEYLTQMSIREPWDVLTWHVARTNQERDRQIYRLAIQAWQIEHRRLKYTDIPLELATHNNRSSFLDRFKVVEGDCTEAHTMVAHISKDGHYYIHPDMSQARSISVREAARIQSFPDNYYFEGSRTAAFKQIGNAVPPQLARTIAEALSFQFGGNINGK